jgi:hypothetical protein
MFRPLTPLLVLALASVVAAQAPPPAKPAEPPAAGEEKKPDAPAVIEDNTGEAAKFAAEQNKALSSKEAKERADGLAAFATHRNELYVKVVVPHLKDKDDGVVKAAIAALGNQPFHSSIDALLAFVCDEKKYSPSDEQRLVAIRALGATGLGKKGYDRLREAYPKFDNDSKNELFATFARAKEKRAFSLMVENMDQPHFSGANRPSTADQKKADDTWQKIKANVRRGLRELTGEGFATAKQYIEWADTAAARKAGFRYERGK